MEISERGPGNFAQFIEFAIKFKKISQEPIANLFFYTKF